MARTHILCGLIAAALTFTVHGQQSFPGVGSPHDGPGKPSGDYSPAWQSYFEVSKPLPNVTWDLPHSFAGNIAVDRPHHPNNTLFFWAFEKERGSLTSSIRGHDDRPWGIWLNGGPGSSSLFGLLFENGPARIASDYSLSSNKFGWNELADYIWIDQPVFSGVGFSTVDQTGYVADEDQMAEDFFGFLTNLVKVFPSLGKRPLYLTGESYAGTYIPYITKAYFGMKVPPVKLAKIAIGDGAIGSGWEFEIAPAVTILETYPQLIGYDTEVFNYFKEQSHLCGFDFNLTYPQHGHFPTLNPQEPAGDDDERAARKSSFREAWKRLSVSGASVEALNLAKRGEGSVFSGRDLTGRANGTIDPYYGCDLFDELSDYASNFSVPWKGNGFGLIDPYDIVDAVNPPAETLTDPASVFLNDNATRAAIHAPTNKDWVESIPYPFGGDPDGKNPSVEPMAFLSELATNASRHNIGLVIYSGNNDALVSHFSSEVVIQNTTFGGIQGFTRRPSTHWFDDSGEFSGIVHQERNWTYVLVKGATHLVPNQQPAKAFVMLREFILGNNPTGLVITSHGHTTVIGGEDPKFVGVLSGQAGIAGGPGSTQFTYTYPAATIAAWESFIATAALTPLSTPTRH